MKHASIGTVSHGTLRTHDLLDSFSYEVQSNIHRNSYLAFALPEYQPLLERLNALLGEVSACFNEDGEIDPEKQEQAEELVNETLPDALQSFAAPYCYFGTHEGDGSDFGFWPDHDAIDELPTLESGVEHGPQDDDYKEVNDHGNVTVFSGSGEVILELV